VTGTKTAARDVTGEIVYLTRALKAPSLRESAGRLAERARSESWTHEEYLAACLQREVAARDAHGGEGRIRGGPVPGPQKHRGVRLRPCPRAERDLIAHLATLDFVAGKENVIFLGPPGTGKPIWPSGWQSAAAKPATGCCSPPPANGSTSSPRPTTADGYKPNWPGWSVTHYWSVDEVGYIPFEPEAANLFFQLVSSRYERASLIVTSNKPFGRWGEVFGDDVVAAMIDRLVHHADVVATDGTQTVLA
jgi:DNA replication protein DnaC